MTDFEEELKAIFDKQFNRLFEGQQKIIEVLDTKLAKQKDEIMQAVDEKLTATEQRISKNTVMLMDAEFKPRFDLLAEGQKDILEKLVPRSRVDDLEEEVKFMKSIIRQMNDDLQKLKKAN